MPRVSCDSEFMYTIMLHCYSSKVAQLFQADELLVGRFNSGLRWREEYKIVQFHFHSIHNSINFMQ